MDEENPIVISGRWLWGAGLLAVYVAGFGALHLALRWFQEPVLLVAG